MVRAYRDGVQARHLAEAGVQQAIREILSQSRSRRSTRAVRSCSTACCPARRRRCDCPRSAHPRRASAPASSRYRISDEEARLNLNGTDRRAHGATARRARARAGAARRHQRLAAGLAGHQRASIAPTERRSDYYLRLPRSLPRAQRATLQDAAELLQIRGVTRELYVGKRRSAGARRVSSPYSAVTS